MNPAPHHVFLTSFGTDRPGIVEDLAAWILEAGGNILDSRMSVLGGEFATIILVSGAEGIDARLENSRQAFEQRTGLTVFTKPAAPKPAGAGGPVLRYNFAATSLDQAGIVHRITAFLRERAVNIVSASTHTTSAPFTGAPVFHFHAAIDIPASVPVNRLRKDLEAFGERENIDFSLTAVA